MKKLVGSFFFLLVLFTTLSSHVLAATGGTSSQYYNGKVRWTNLKGAKYYNVYYKQSGTKGYDFGVSHLSLKTNDFTLKKLKTGQTYWYRVSAVDKYGKEVWLTPLTKVAPIS